MKAQRRLLYVVNTDWYFVTHRLAHARAAVASGYDVHVACPDSGWVKSIREGGIQHHLLPMGRGRGSVGFDLRTLWNIARLLRRIRPDILHLVATRAVVLGGLVALTRPKLAVVAAVTGQGYDAALRDSRFLRTAVSLVLRRTLNRKRTVGLFQTEHDREFYVEKGYIDRRRTVLIPGVGVDLSFWQMSLRPDVPTVLFASRLLREKGFWEVVEAGRRLRQQHPGLRLLVAGRPEPDLPTGVTDSDLRLLVEAGDLEYVGHARDMRRVFEQASVYVLPSYHREGIPKALLEAAASGLPIVTSNTPGCSSVVIHGHSGLLVQPRDTEALVTAVHTLISDRRLAATLAANARARVAENFSFQRAVSETLKVYDHLLSGSLPDQANRGEGAKTFTARDKARYGS